MRNFRVGLPSKGRLAELSAELFSQAGLNFRRQERTLFARVKEMPVDITFLRAEDIPVLCAEGAIEMGVTGADLIAESGADVVSRLPLGVGKCRLAVCVPEHSALQTPADLRGARVATSFPRVSREFFARHGVTPHFVELSGSVEVMTALGVADAIVDLVETGSTLAANQLRLLAEIGQYETVLIHHKACAGHELAERVTRRLEGVVIARGYSLLVYNVPRARLEEARGITPGYNSPTVNALQDSDWCEVTVMVRRGQVIEAMERLEAIGATAILETQITNCRL